MKLTRLLRGAAAGAAIGAMCVLLLPLSLLDVLADLVSNAAARRKK